MERKIIVGLGEALWDVMPEERKIGGAPANFAYHASQMGHESYVVSAIGKDNWGDEVVRQLEAKGLNLMLSRVDFPTGEVNVTYKSPTEPIYDICEGSAWDNIPFTDEMKSLAERADAVCFGSLAQRNPVSRATIYQFLDSMRSEGTLKVYDINLRQNYYNREIVEESLHRSNALKINEDEIVVICRMLELGEVDINDEESVRRIGLELMKRYNLNLVIVTCGSTCSYAITADCFNKEMTPKVEVVDAVGAGDSFTATFCSAYLAGKDVVTAHRLAVQVAAEVCRHAGAMPTMPAHMKEKLL